MGRWPFDAHQRAADGKVDALVVAVVGAEGLGDELGKEGQRRLDGRRRVGLIDWSADAAGTGGVASPRSNGEDRPGGGAAAGRSQHQWAGIGEPSVAALHTSSGAGCD